jgi:hypothetical protein
VAAALRTSGLMLSVAEAGQLGKEKAALGLAAWLRATADRSPAFVRIVNEELLRPAKSDVPRSAASAWISKLTQGGGAGGPGGV